MDSDEREIYCYLKGQPDQFVSAHSISRHAGGKHRFRDSPDWARPVLLRMKKRGIVVMDATGAYRLGPLPSSESTTKRWVSPQIAAILRRSGQDFEHLADHRADPDTYYNSL